MKALITAGGRGTRLRPITHTMNKHLIPLAGQPMLFYALDKVANAGVKEVIINTNEGEKELQEVVGNGSKWGVKITYFEQKGGAKGLADVVRQAEKYIGTSPFVFYLGDNVVVGHIKKFVNHFKKERLNCFLGLARVEDPTRFGVPVIDKGKIVEVIEKPEVPPSPFAVTGIYIYDKHIFDVVKHLKPSARGELEISDAHTRLIKKGLKVGYKEITGWWKDTGLAEDLLEANQLLLRDLKKRTIQGSVEKGVVLQGGVKIGKKSRIEGKTLIRGPVVIGENCIIRDTYIGPYSSIGNNVEMYAGEIDHSIIFDDVDIHTDTRIVDSIIGVNSTLIPTHMSMPSGHKLIIGSNSMVEL